MVTVVPVGPEFGESATVKLLPAADAKRTDPNPDNTTTAITNHRFIDDTFLHSYSLADASPTYVILGVDRLRDSDQTIAS
jgi:hypothetical protein